MFRPSQLPVPLLLSLLLASPPLLSQDKTGEDGKAPVSSSQEVEVNEDMYRQFMELKDARQQRMIMPEDAFKPGSGSQKLDKLPEESQKHLRNQLREIILQGDAWQPGDENTQYPYVPSEAALANTDLQKQEAEAWGELLDSYHKREAQIYENSARTKAAMASSKSAPGSDGEGSSQNRASSANPGGQAQPGEQSNQQSRSRQAGNDQQEAPKAARITSSSSSAGVSQNAKEFLQRMQNKPGGNGATQAAQPAADAVAGSDPVTAPGGPGGPETRANDVTEAPGTAKSTASSRPADNRSDNPAAQNPAGVSQNALEFLQQSGQEGDRSAAMNAEATRQANDGDGQMADAGDQSVDTENTKTVAGAEGQAESPAAEAQTGDTPGTTQNALEYVIGERSARDDGQPQQPTEGGSASGTLSITDLVNARGVGTGSKPLPPPALKDKEPPADKPPPGDKDG